MAQGRSATEKESQKIKRIANAILIGLKIYFNGLIMPSLIHAGHGNNPA